MLIGVCLHLEIRTPVNDRAHHVWRLVVVTDDQRWRSNSSVRQTDDWKCEHLTYLYLGVLGKIKVFQAFVKL